MNIKVRVIQCGHWWVQGVHVFSIGWDDGKEMGMYREIIEWGKL